MSILVFDSECYRNYYLVSFRNVETGNVRSFEFFDGHALDIENIKAVLKRYTLVGFNSINYDMPILSLALRGVDNAMLKKLSDAIIVTQMKPWTTENVFGYKVISKIDHIDIFDVAPGKASLKAYGGRLHTKKMQDLPIDPSAGITPEQRVELRKYCENDLILTQELYEHLIPQIELRKTMSAEYGIDLRSKSDAQVAEAVIKTEIEKLSGVKPVRPEIAQGTVYKYAAPEFISFNAVDILDYLKTAEFVIGNGGKVIMPKELNDRIIRIGASEYRMGIGGLHSCEESVSHVADEDTLLIDRDVISYYPRIILNCGLYPKHLGKRFLEVYKKIFDRRVAAKKSGDKVTAESLKITLNGSFGKLGSMWSALYSPDLMVQVTLTGQLSLLMLIELLEDADIRVVSANTDGIVIKCRCDQEKLVNSVVSHWERLTGFETEDTRYTAIYSRDINNYLAVKDKGYKVKGAYTPPGFQKNPTNEISTEAVIAFLSSGEPIECTIAGCRDIRKFVTVRSVTGGAMKDDKYLGKAVRWYYSSQTEGYITYKLNGRIVARSEGGRPIMELPDEFPNDIDYGWYANEAKDILKDIGYARV